MLDFLLVLVFFDGKYVICSVIFCSIVFWFRILKILKVLILIGRNILFRKSLNDFEQVVEASGMSTLVNLSYYSIFLVLFICRVLIFIFFFLLCLNWLSCWPHISSCYLMLSLSHHLYSVIGCVYRFKWLLWFFSILLFLLLIKYFGICHLFWGFRLLGSIWEFGEEGFG